MKEEIFFLHRHDLNHGPLQLIASVLPMSFADPLECIINVALT